MMKCALAQHAGSRPGQLHSYITYGAKMYVLSADEALITIRKVIPVRVKGG